MYCAFVVFYYSMSFFARTKRSFSSMFILFILINNTRQVHCVCCVLHICQAGADRNSGTSSVYVYYITTAYSYMKNAASKNALVIRITHHSCERSVQYNSIKPVLVEEKERARLDL